MKKELQYFEIENSFGGSQAWFSDRFMRIGGCAAAAACDSCLCLEREQKIRGLSPFDGNELTKEQYVSFSRIMKPYLHPRLFGVNRLDLYIRGFDRYLAKQNCERLRMEGFSGDRSAKEAKEAIQTQIDAAFPVPCLTLQHRDPGLQDYVWHWFMLTGYDCRKDAFLVKAATYGRFRWIDLEALWNTGYKRKGGLILYRIRN